MTTLFRAAIAYVPSPHSLARAITGWTCISGITEKSGVAGRDPTEHLNNVFFERRYSYTTPEKETVSRFKENIGYMSLKFTVFNTAIVE